MTLECIRGKKFLKDRAVENGKNLNTLCIYILLFIILLEICKDMFQIFEKKFGEI